MSVWRATLTGTMYNQKMQNVLHFNNQDNAMPVATMAQHLRNEFILDLRTIQNVNFSWNSIQLQELVLNPAPPYVEALTNMPGGLAGLGAPPFVCGLFSIRTGIGGRSGRGRFYMGGVHQESVSNGQLHPNALLAYQDVANFIKNRFKVGGSIAMTMVVCNRDIPPSQAGMINIVARSQFGVQRRRNINVGI